MSYRLLICPKNKIKRHVNAKDVAGRATQAAMPDPGMRLDAIIYTSWECLHKLAIFYTMLRLILYRKTISLVI
jgi:hypothetical protein